MGIPGESTGPSNSEELLEAVGHGNPPPDEIKNGNPSWVAENGIRITVKDEENAMDILSGGNNDTPNTGTENTTPREPGIYNGQEYVDQQPPKTKEEKKRIGAHNRALKSNEEANRGMTKFIATPGMQDALGNLDNIQKKLKNDPVTSPENKPNEDTAELTPRQIADKQVDDAINQAYENQRQAREKQQKELEDSKKRQEDMRRFRDQENVGKGENVPESKPMPESRLTVTTQPVGTPQNQNEKKTELSESVVKAGEHAIGLDRARRAAEGKETRIVPANTERGMTTQENDDPNMITLHPNGDKTYYSIDGSEPQSKDILDNPPPQDVIEAPGEIKSPGHISITPENKDEILDRIGTAREEGKKRRHQEALDSNDKANEGINVQSGPSDAGKDFFERQFGGGSKEEDNDTQPKAPLSQEEKDRLHQEALDSNDKANEGINVQSGPSDAGKDFFERQFGGSQKEEDDRAPQPQGAESSDSNEDQSPDSEQAARIEELEGRIATMEALVADGTITRETADSIIINIENKIDAINNGSEQIEEESVPEEVAELQRQVAELTAAVEALTNQLTGRTTTEQESDDDGEDEDQVPPPPTIPAAATTEGTTNADQTRIDALEDEIRTLRGENTPEQQLVSLDQQMEDILGDRSPSELSNDEKIQYFDLQIQRDALANSINAEKQESEKKRNNRNKWIRRAAGAVGFGVALASPPVGVAAVVAVSLGGKIAGPLIKKGADKMRAKADGMKYESRRGATMEQLNDRDRKIKRKEKWANILGGRSSSSRRRRSRLRWW